jgi:superfamily II DNA or RNA helicase
VTATAVPDQVSFPVGSLVSARGREWVVQTGSTDQLLKLKPIAGADDDLVGVMPAIEAVTSASFPPPSLDDLGTAADAQLLRDAFRIGVADPAGPFRGFGRIAVRPRPYQLVPLLMGLRLLGAPDEDAHPAVRMLISDDVGIGKTIESLLIANELLTTGEADGLAVVCPPHLADQWVAELRTKFHLDAVKVGASTVRRLERGLAVGESLFDRHKLTVVSLDWVKSKRRRDEFAHSAPNLVIVDEAHLCARDDANTTKHLRHELLKRLAAETHRHLLLVTATPHSGKEGAFRSLIGLLHLRLADTDAEVDLTSDERALLARHFVARKRIDVADYLGATSFPTRLDLTDAHGRWRPSGELEALIVEVMDWAKPRLERATSAGDARKQRVWWWSMLGLIRALGSSPAAGAATLRKRAGTVEVAEDADLAVIDEVGRLQVTDPDLDTTEADDVEAGAQVEDDDTATFLAFADRLDEMAGPRTDPKLAKAIAIAKTLLDSGHAPIFFCRFIGTAEYLGAHLDVAIKQATVTAVTGTTPAEVRASDVADLARHERRILVATDCLSEGINLQEHFDAIVHYDLPWNPTRLEQREGRVDRYGQTAPEIRVATMQGDNPTLDPLIRKHLIDKHHAIKQQLGFSIPVPGITDEIIDAVANEWLYGASRQTTLDLDGAEARWREATERELEWETSDQGRRSRAKYAQRTIDPTAVADMVDAADAAVGTPTDTARFLVASTRALGGIATGDPTAASQDGTGTLTLGLTGLPRQVHGDLAATLAVKVDDLGQLQVRTHDPAPVTYGTQRGAVLARTHPFVAELARHITDPALDRHVTDAPAARLAVVATDQVGVRTWLLTCRFRFDLATQRRRRLPDGTYRIDAATHLVEDVHVVGIAHNQLLDPDAAAALLNAEATRNLPDSDRREIAAQTLDRLTARWPDLLDDAALARGQLLETQHTAARQAVARGEGMGTADVHPHPNPDVLAVTCLVPAGSL